ncbi:hypothetical protein CNYM01_13475 [Colletotrichum nymphaeae SA-01]|uniref:Uncharacterized protein n=1 Tax=Colletotrichum nymphaeae SA-01 TaxID=1460502 RepID=A0A135T6X3_9PEZI|nr:hypothetical protein CNYM01_13475 [Colletotrichum nymphaeae SA-01]
MDGKRRASCEQKPDLLSIDPVTSLRGSICNRKADRPPKPTLINSRTSCKQLAKRHRGSNVSYETMTRRQSRLLVASWWLLQQSNSAGHLSTPRHDHPPFGSTPPWPSTYCVAPSQALRPQALLSTLTHWPAAHVELKNRRCIGGSMAKTWQAAHPCSANIEDDWGVLGATGHGGCSTQRTLTWVRSRSANIISPRSSSGWWQSLSTTHIPPPYHWFNLSRDFNHQLFHHAPSRRPLHISSRFFGKLESQSPFHLRLTTDTDLHRPQLATHPAPGDNYVFDSLTRRLALSTFLLPQNDP